MNIVKMRIFLLLLILNTASAVELVINSRFDYDSAPAVHTVGNASKVSGYILQSTSENPTGPKYRIPTDKKYKPENTSVPITSAICGSNSLGRTTYASDCRLAITFTNGQTSSCSAFVIGSRHLATAGHCVYNSNTGWARAIDIYCGGGSVCGSSAVATAQAARFSTTTGWFNERQAGTTNVYDAGVILTHANIPYSPYGYRELSCTGSTTYVVTGYPGGDSRHGPECAASGYNVCTQLTTTGNGQCAPSGGWLTPDVDTCGGHSGSSAFAIGYAIGIFTGDTDSPGDNPCRNYVVPIKNSGNNGGNGNGGGVWLKRLVDAVPA